MSPLAAAELGLMLTLGLQAIHEHGILHCGLQTGDVVMAPDGRPKIGNFAAARRCDGAGNESGLEPDWVLPHYQSPEILDGDWDRVGKSSDIYALGAVLYDLVAGRPPFSAPTLAETRNKVRREPPDVPTGVAPELDAVVRKCLEKDPKRRYQSAGELALALQLFVKPPPVGQDSSSVLEGTVVAGGIVVRDSVVSFRLRVIGGPARVGDTFELPRRRLVIGRSKHCDVTLPGKSVSRMQCGVIWNNDSACHEVLDLVPRNATFVNSEPVNGRRRLFPGDQIQFVDYILMFERLPQAAG